VGVPADLVVRSGARRLLLTVSAPRARLTADAEGIVVCVPGCIAGTFVGAFAAGGTGVWKPWAGHSLLKHVAVQGIKIGRG
jgi:hypothetical protein